MDTARAAQTLAEASSSMTRPLDVVGALVALLDGCKYALDVDAGGVLVESGDGLDVLAASSHRTAVFEMHQLHAEQGPCVDAHSLGAPVTSHSPEALLQTWPEFGPTMVTTGFCSVYATPLRIQGRTFGALGLFRRADRAFDADEVQVIEAFGDIAAMIIAHLGRVDDEELTDRLAEALSSRVVLEQAKGVLADTHGISLAEAYTLLVQGARSSGRPLTEWAGAVIERAQTR